MKKIVIQVSRVGRAVTGAIVDGPHLCPEPGYAVGLRGLFGIYRIDRTWNIVHLPTGYQAGNGFPTRAGAHRAACAYERLPIPWESKNVTRLQRAIGCGKSRMWAKVKSIAVGNGMKIKPKAEGK